MKPVDCRNATFAELQGRLEGQRGAVLAAWHTHGPGTTEQIAAAAGMSVLTFRPRTTELYQIGALECTGHLRGEGGVYRARTEQEWQAFHAEQAQPATVTQQQMALA